MALSQTQWGIHFCEDSAAEPFADELFKIWHDQQSQQLPWVMRKLDRLTSDWTIADLTTSDYYPVKSNIYALSVPLRGTEDVHAVFLGTPDYTSDGTVFHVLCAFIKKTDSIPSIYIDRAEKRYTSSFLLHKIPS